MAVDKRRRRRRMTAKLSIRRRDDWVATVNKWASGNHISPMPYQQPFSFSAASPNNFHGKANTVKHCPQGWQGREGKTGTLREISHPAGNWVARMTSNKLRQVGASPGNAQVSGMMFEIWPFKNSTSSEVARWWNDDNYTKFSMRDILVVVMMMMIMKMIVRQPEKLAFRYPNIN